MTDHDHHQNPSSNNYSALVTGALLGAALTYLFGTKSGRKLKDELVKEGQKLIGEMGAQLEEVSNKIGEGEVGKKLEAAKGKIEDTKQSVEEAKEDLEEVVEDVPKHIEELQKKGRRFFFHRSASHES